MDKNETSRVLRAVAYDELPPPDHYRVKLAAIEALSAEKRIAELEAEIEKIHGYVAASVGETGKLKAERDQLAKDYVDARGALELAMPLVGHRACYDPPRRLTSIRGREHLQLRALVAAANAVLARPEPHCIKEATDATTDR